ncbi:MAG: glycosyltransferase [Chloroflexi bacterium]|nr:glycosyltransferase [Anaerolineaceae bacterium]NMB89970.1 glycosyltransferase [Chloroflexota bacterium]
MSLVSIIVPCYNEKLTIRLLLDAIQRQSFPHESIEVIIADGLSTDGTRDEVNAFLQTNPGYNVRIVDNPKRIIPAALNRALEAAQGEYIIRLDAHCIPERDYVQRCVQALEDHLGDNVGGVWDIRPGDPSWVAQSISIAAGHRLGVGDARYRYTTEAGEVDTVPFGAFRRALVDELGAFDETLLTNEDYEFNARIRQINRKVWLDPTIRSVYFARRNYLDLARQYWRYGYWKWRMLRRYPATLRWRQALPPAFVASVIILALLSGWLPARVLLLAELAVYLVALALVGLESAIKHKKLFLAFGVPVAIAVMHFSWGAGFLWSILNTPNQQHGENK